MAPLAKGGLVVWVPPLLAIWVSALVIISFSYWIGIGYLWDKWHLGWFSVWLVVSLYCLISVLLGQYFPLIEQLIPEGLNAQEISAPFYPLNTVSYWSEFSTYWALAWICASLNKSSVKLIFGAIVIAALFQAIYGLVAFVHGQETILGIWQKTRYFESVTGTFYNRNHLAGFFAIALPVGITFILKRPIFRWERKMLFRIVLCTAFASLICIALLGTASRLGILCAFVGMLIWLRLNRIKYHADKEKRSIWIIRLVILSFVFFLGLWFGFDTLLTRLMELPDATSRIEIWSAMLNVPWQVWILGVGPGAFIDVYKLVQPLGQIPSYWRAHNEYLQFVFEFGIVGTVCVFVSLSFWFRWCRPKRLSYLQIAAFAAISAIALHSLGDFDLQVPGTAVPFWICLGVLFNRQLSDSNMGKSRLL